MPRSCALPLRLVAASSHGIEFKRDVIARARAGGGVACFILCGACACSTRCKRRATGARCG